MPRTPNLFLLIHSLSKAEKRYFKLQVAGGRADSNSLKLFNAIERQKEYDEKAIKKQFHGQKFVSQLHVTKSYLTDLLLRSLRNFHTHTTSHTEITILLHEIELLFDKELYELCVQKIQRARKLATQYEHFPLLMEVLSWDRRLQVSHQGAANPAGLSELLHNEEETLYQMADINRYWRILADGISRRTGTENDEMPPAVAGKESLQGQILKSHIRFMRHIMNHESGKADNELKELVQFLENHPDRMRENPGPLATVLSNRIGLLLAEKRLDEIPSLINQIREIPQKYDIRVGSKFTARVRLRLFNVELELYRDTKELERGIGLIEEIQAFFERYPNTIPDDYRILLHYQFAYLYYLKGDYAESLHWINEVINERVDARLDVQTFARFLGLIAHFELNNIIVLRYAVDSCRRFLKRKKNLQAYETVLLGLFSKLSLALPEEYPHCLKQAYEQLFSQSTMAVSGDVLDYVDIKTWLEQKLLVYPANSSARVGQRRV